MFWEVFFVTTKARGLRRQKPFAAWPPSEHYSSEHKNIAPTLSGIKVNSKRNRHDGEWVKQDSNPSPQRDLGYIHGAMHTRTDIRPIILRGSATFILPSCRFRIASRFDICARMPYRHWEPFIYFRMNSLRCVSVHIPQFYAVFRISFLFNETLENLNLYQDGHSARLTNFPIWTLCFSSVEISKVGIFFPLAKTINFQSLHIRPFIHRLWTDHALLWSDPLCNLYNKQMLACARQ